MTCPLITLRRRRERTFIKEACVAIALAFAATAPRAGSDITDLWYDPADSGWGLGVFQQGNVAFVTLFTYDSSGRPAWYVGSDVRNTGTNFDPCGSSGFSGTLYAMTGPVLGSSGTEVPRATGSIGIGLHTVSAPACNTDINVRLEVDGRVVERRLVRQTWGSQHLQGRFRGAYVAAPGNSTCSRGNIHGRIEVSLQDGDILISIDDDRDPLLQFPPSCRWRGTYRQVGRSGELTGTEQCGAIINPRRLTMRDLNVNDNGISALITYPDPDPCSVGAARLGGARTFQ